MTFTTVALIAGGMLHIAVLVRVLTATRPNPLLLLKAISEVEKISIAEAWQALDFAGYLVGSTTDTDGGVTLNPVFETGG